MSKRRLQPRNNREQRLVDETLADADQIKAARQESHDRAIVISPHRSQSERQEAEKRLRALKGKSPLSDYIHNAGSRAYSQALQDIVRFPDDEQITAARLVELVSGREPFKGAWDTLTESMENLARVTGMSIMHPRFIFTAYLLMIERMTQGFKGKGAANRRRVCDEAYAEIQEIVRQLDTKQRKAS